ncbi:MAG: aminotransferase class I/II-fold pyridoxal phosphate-dependent enzyme [Desulfobacterales bacterium]|nr:aminotransferase class I/II-fold pyridoxal phosphate-dependent enzyme [Desulfobacterales bacterium]
MQTHNPEETLLAARREFGEHGGVAPSISRSSTFTVMEPGTMPEIFQGLKSHEKEGCFLYSRHFNPTVDVLSRYLAAMEGAEAAICTASGMSAISCALLQICRSGDHIVSSDTIYGGTHALMYDLLPDMKITTSFLDIADLDAVEAAMTDATRVIFTETVGNPTLKTADIAKLAEIAHARNALLVVDNTFTPMIFSPAMLGADVVVYSMTKFINGSSDLIAGAICGGCDFINSLMDLHTGRVMLLGPTMDARVAFDIIQRLPHLPIRMREHGRRAMAISERLHEMGAAVVYPGLASYPQHELFRSMHNEGFGFGGMLTLDCETSERANRLMSVLQNEENFGLIAVSLGYFDTLMSCSGSSTSSEISDDDQKKMGLSPGLLRIAIGYTGSLETRIAQIERALNKLGLV